MKIPKNAKRVFKGIIFDVYQWQQKMFDGSFQTFEMIKRPGTVEVIATQDNKIVIAEQEQPTKSLCFSMLGGRQEENESPLDTTKRELLEESGLKSDNWELIKTFEGAHNIDHQIYVFVARNCKKVSAQKLEPGEKIKLKSITFKEFLNIIYSDKLWCKPLTDDLFRIKNNKKELDKFRMQIFPK